MWTVAVTVGIVLALPPAEPSCVASVESVNCTRKEHAHLVYTCRSTPGDGDCKCVFDNPLRTEKGWFKMCKTKFTLPSRKQRLRKRQLPGATSCPALQPPSPGKVSCTVSPSDISCVGTCDEGHRFADGSPGIPYSCRYAEGSWSPTDTFPACLPVCGEPCQNGGNCTASDFCSCPNDYRGNACQYPITLCGISKSQLASSWHCNHTREETACDVSCHAPDTPEADLGSRRFVCSVEGEWTPPLPPCVTVPLCPEPPAVEDGSWRLVVGRVFGAGSRLLYSCRPGLQLRGPSAVTCLGKGTWSGGPPTCHFEPEDACEDPGVIRFGERDGQQPPFAVGSVVSYRCSDRFTLLGSPRLTCRADGRWTSRKPVCLPGNGTSVLCPKPNVPKNAVVQVSFPDQHPLRTFFNSDIPLSQKLYLMHLSRHGEDSFPVGTRIQYRCRNRFYKLYGSQYQTCLSSQTWSGYQPACVPDCGRSDAPRTPFIVNGNASQLGHWPWQVGLALKGPRGPQLICGGVLVSELWVLTAAHCVAKKFSNTPMDTKELFLFCGKYFRGFQYDDQGVQVRQVRQIVIHEEYDFVHFDADIALLQMDGPVQLTPRVQPVCLPTEDTTRENVRDGKRGIVLGWGLTEEGQFSPTLRETILPVVGHDRCEEAYRRGLRTVTITRNMFCAGQDTGLSDTCNGDSGGPFLFPDGPANDHRWYVEGLVSWGSESGCGKALHYSGFTRVDRFVPWINMFL